MTKKAMNVHDEVILDRSNLQELLDALRRKGYQSVGPKVRFDPLNTFAMLCGPEIMMHYTIQAWVTNTGWTTGQVFLSPAC